MEFSLFLSFYDTPLHVAAYDGHFDAVYRLIVHGADINAYSNGDDSKTPLNYALYQNHRPVIAYLIKNGADRSHLDFRNVPYREEMIQFVNEGYLDDEYDAEKLVSRACTGRIEDVLDFEYPQCVEIDPRKRYTNQEYIKEVIDRNQQKTDKSTDEKDHQDTKDDHDDQDHKDPKDDQDNHGIAFL